MTLLDNVPLELIQDDPATQPRERLDDETVERYADAMAEGQQLPPIIIYHDGETYWLADGWHRREAARRLQRASILAEVRRGGKREAILHAVGANATHGLPRSNADKRRAVTIMINDPEWSKMSDHEIARRTRTSQPFVSKIRRELSDNGYQMPEARTVRRGDQVYQQRVRAPEPTEAEIEIARDLVSRALIYWKRPVNFGYVVRGVWRQEGGAHMGKKAIKAALYRMVEAGTVIETKDEYKRTVYTLPSPKRDDRPRDITAELDAKFDRDAITILGLSDDGAEPDDAPSVQALRDRVLKAIDGLADTAARATGILKDSMSLASEISDEDAMLVCWSVTKTQEQLRSAMNVLTTLYLVLEAD